MGLNDEWAKIHFNVDLDGDGKIDFHEFMVASVNHDDITSESNIACAF